MALPIINRLRRRVRAQPIIALQTRRARCSNYRSFALFTHLRYRYPCKVEEPIEIRVDNVLKELEIVIYD